MENNNLYVNVAHLLGLYECVKLAAVDTATIEAIEAAEEIVYDLPWKEIKDENEKISTIWNGRKNKAVNQ